MKQGPRVGEAAPDDSGAAGSTNAAPSAGTESAHPGLARLQACLEAVLHAHEEVADDATRLDQLAMLEHLRRAAAAAQYAIQVEFADSQRQAQLEAGVPEAQSGRGIPTQIALAMRTSPHRAGIGLGVARALVTEMVHTFAALQAGIISEYVAFAVVRETATLTAHDRRTVDEALAGHLDRASDREIIARARAHGYELDPTSALRRGRRAATDRRVSLRAAPDTMAYLTAYVPAADGVAAYAALQRAATSARADGDARGIGQTMADTLTERLTGHRASHHDLHGTTQSAGTDNQAGDKHAADDKAGDEASHTSTPTSRPADPDSSQSPRRSDDHSNRNTRPAAPAAPAAAAAGADRSTGHADRPPSTAHEFAELTPNGRPRHRPGDILPDYPHAAAPQAHVSPPPHQRATGTAPKPSEADASWRSHVQADPQPPDPDPNAPHPNAPHPNVPDPHAPDPNDAHPNDPHPNGPQSEPDGSDSAPETPCDRVPIELRLVMSDTSLFADDDAPALLNGDPIPAWLARDLITDPQTRVSVRRLYQHPTTGQLLAMESRRRLFDGVLKEFVTTRDKICRTPGCGARIRHIDHVRRHAEAGATHTDNGQGLCEACNLAKEANGWTFTTVADPTAGAPPRVIITTPTGHTYESTAPDLIPRLPGGVRRPLGQVDDVA